MTKSSAISLSLLAALLLCSCCRFVEKRPSLVFNAYSLTIFVSAKHFDYSSCQACLTSLAKTRDGRFGHAWICLRGLRHGQPLEITGSHSGELGRRQPSYCDGVADLVDCGDPNPIRYLWEVQRDGFFQQGSGGHRPTYAAQVTITPEQFEAIANFMENYPYNEYCLTGRQCTTFCIKIAALAGWKLEGNVTLNICSEINFRGIHMCLWHDPRYSSITFATPDLLEQSLKESVKAGRAGKCRLTGDYVCIDL